MVLAKAGEDATEHWLVEDNQIELNAIEGFPFKVVSKSAVYTVIRNDEAGVEWMMSSKLLGQYEINSKVTVNVNQEVLKYKLK
jgi:hypothetical protein